MAENKKVLVAGFHIVWTTDHCINKYRQTVLDSLTSLSLAKAYYSLVQQNISVVGVTSVIGNT